MMSKSVPMTARSLFKLKRIPVPIDFSGCSKKALQYAIPLAEAHQAAITLLFVVPPPYGTDELVGIDYPQVEQTMCANGKDELEKLRSAEVRTDAPMGTMVGVGSPAFSILDAAGKLSADLILSSAHGRTGLRHVFLGSVAEQIVQRAPCPVFVVREREHEILDS